MNGFGFLQGPFGTGKTEIIRILMEIMRHDNKRLVATSARNSNCDHIVQTLRRGAINYMCVRLHGIGKSSQFPILLTANLTCLRP